MRDEDDREIDRLIDALRSRERNHYYHFIERCRHGVVVRQCRCPGANKMVSYFVPCPPDCNGTGSTLREAIDDTITSSEAPSAREDGA